MCYSLKNLLWRSKDLNLAGFWKLQEGNFMAVKVKLLCDLDPWILRIGFHENDCTL